MKYLLPFILFLLTLPSIAETDTLLVRDSSSSTNVVELQRTIMELKNKIARQQSQAELDLREALMTRHEPPMDRISDIIMATAFFITVCLIMWLFFSTRHKERLAAIDKGLEPETVKSIFSNHFQSRIPAPLASLRWGLLLLGAGIGGIIGSTLHFINDGIIVLTIITGAGLGLIIFYLLAGRKNLHL